MGIKYLRENGLSMEVNTVPCFHGFALSFFCFVNDYKADVSLFFHQRAVFQGLSQEALSACIQSLLGASESISKNKV